MLSNPYKLGSQKYRIFEEMVVNGKAEIWKMITPKPLGGMGIALYTVRLTEMRQDLKSYGYAIVNEAGKWYRLKKIEEQEKLI